MNTRNRDIAERFGAVAADYERKAALQRHIAARLSGMLPKLERPRVLELGCGTGLLSRNLLRAYPGGRFLFSDLSGAMLAECRKNLEGAEAEIGFAEIDAADPGDCGPFDLIATSMTLHWLDRPEAVLNTLRARLSPGGSLVFAGLGPRSFAEWRTALEAEGLPSGLVSLQELPGAIDEEDMIVQENGLAFLRRLKAIGGLTPKAAYRPLPPGALRRALRRLDREFGGRMTWHIVYGRLSPMETSRAASRSSPSMMPL